MINAEVIKVRHITQVATIPTSKTRPQTQARKESKESSKEKQGLRSTEVKDFPSLSPHYVIQINFKSSRGKISNIHVMTSTLFHSFGIPSSFLPQP